MKQGMISGQFQGTTFTVITLNRESNCTCREKRHSLFHYEKIDVTTATSATLDVMLERSMDDCWNIEGDRDLSGAWTGFTRVTIQDEKPPDGHTWSGGLIKKQTPSRPDHLWPDIWKNMSDAAQRKTMALSKNQSSIMLEN